jgi:menaquinone-specific isochorismate synthase
MQAIATHLHRTADRASVIAFIQACIDEADTDNHPKIVSVSLAIDPLDPLAVLDLIYDPQAWHFYSESPGRDLAVAGAEALVIHTAHGPDRCRSVQRFANQWLEHTIAVGDVDLPLAGPHFFCGLTFADSAPIDAPFAPASVFLPRWQAARCGSVHVAVANCLVNPGDDPQPHAERLLRAHQRLAGTRLQRVPPATGKVVTTATDPGHDPAYEQAVAIALQRIASSVCHKVVLARALDLQTDQPFQPLHTLSRLRQRFPACHLFSFENDQGVSCIGASPERLVEIANGTLHTEAIAGSAPRGDSPASDHTLAANLIHSAKDKREHQLVIDSIQRRLQTLGVALQNPAKPRLLQLANVQHLHTPLTAAWPAGRHIMEAVAALHPTPAVGGSPREEALPIIAELEPVDRSLYSGAIGWFDHRGEGAFTVAIRSAIMRGRNARLFAGAGIVHGSDPATELRETYIKMSALLDALTAE